MEATRTLCAEMIARRQGRRRQGDGPHRIRVVDEEFSETDRMRTRRPAALNS
jgi:hypothetical protein